MKKLYRYKGPVYNNGTIFKSIDEYVHAHTPSQALKILGGRLRKQHGLLLWLKKYYLTEREVVHEPINPNDKEIQMCWSCSHQGCKAPITHKIIKNKQKGLNVLHYCEQHFLDWRRNNDKVNMS